MCGIAGSVDLSRSTSAERLHDMARTMADALRHRGPDDLGSWVDEDVGLALGHSRLAVLDPTAGGHEPMVSADGRYVISFNGEIYNHWALRRLLTDGPHFKSDCDAETLLEAIAAWGVLGALKRSDGMFAFAVYDRCRRELTLARDRMGEKPLYYGWIGGQLLFGSELKSLRAHPRFDAQIDRDALASYLRLAYVPSPRSIFRGISKLAPGTLVTVALDRPDPAPTPETYWSLAETARRGMAAPLDLSPAAATDAFEDLLRQSVDSRMLADVPVGAFLSGGVDSSTVVAMMQSVSSSPVRTFSIGVGAHGFDEAHHAAAVARHLGTEHTQHYVTSEEAMGVVPTLPELYDEPFADSSQIPTLLVSSLARQHVTVALSGDGADELFGGYVRHVVGGRLGTGLRRTPRVIRRGLAATVQAIPDATWDRIFSPSRGIVPRRLRQAHAGQKLSKLADVLGADADALYLRLVSQWPEPSSVVIGGVDTWSPPTLRSYDDGVDDFLEWMLYADGFSYLPDDILAKVDRASMSRSLEVRVPFLALDVVEFAWSLPKHLKIHGGQGKWIVREVLQHHVPPSVIERPKQGFAVPIGEWLRGPLRDWAEALISERRLRRDGFFEPQPVRRAWSEHLARRRDRSSELWAVLMFQAWLDSSGAAAGDDRVGTREVPGAGRGGQ